MAGAGAGDNAGPAPVTLTDAAPDSETAPLCETDCSKVPVYPLIHEIRVDIVEHIDTPLTYDQLVAADSTYTIIRPLTEKYLCMRNPSVVFCLLLNKVQFVSDSHQLSIATLSESRAVLCEILAIRVLRGWSERSLPLATVLLTPWPLFQGAPEAVIQAAKDEGEEEALDDSGMALELAIISTSKRFIRSPSCQKVIEGIWSGKIVYSFASQHALIQDNYKKRPIQIYNPHKAPVLDHYRLKVPKIRAILEYANFLILFILYITAIEKLELLRINGPEAMFIVYALAFSLDKAATIREHGLKVFASSMVNGFDLVFVIIFAVYLGARLFGVYTHDEGALELGTDLLAVGAVLMFPRLAFMTLANNLMLLSIRSMLVEFFILMSVGIFCFLGFIYALRTLGNGNHPVSQICWWLLEVYFGLDATGFESSADIHPILGPVLMVLYGFLSNTLLLTVSVAVLGNTFAAINADAPAESMFRKAVATIEGVKADSVFSYQLPFNLLAVAVLYPLSFVLNPRWFHKVNVFMIRLTNLPVLLIIALWERQQYNESTVWEQFCDKWDHYLGRISAATEGFVGARLDVSAVFELEREYGTVYKDWDDDVFEDDDDSVQGGGDEETPADAGLTGDGQITLSPEEESFHFSGSPSNSPSAPRHRRRSSAGVAPPHNHPHYPHGHAPTPPVPGVAPLPRLRRNSIWAASPLAQIYTRNNDFDPYAPHRRSTLVGSLPATMNMPNLALSPRRQRVSFANPALSAGPSGLSSSVSNSSMGSMERQKTSARPSIPPIEEVSTPSLEASPAKPAKDTPEKIQLPPSRRVPFPQSMDDRRIVSFNEPQRPRAAGTRSVSESKTEQLRKAPVEPDAPSPKDTSPETSALPSPAAKTVPLPGSDRPAALASPALPPASPMLKPSKKTPPSPKAKSDLLQRPSTPRMVSSPSLSAKKGRPPPKTASELLESMESHNEPHSSTTLEAQLAAVEARQQRIEELLEQLISCSTSKRGVSMGKRGAETHDDFDETCEGLW